MQAIKRGDRLVLKTHGMEIPVEALSGVDGGSLQIKHNGGISTVNIHDVRLADEGAITGNQPQVSTGTPPCPECGKPGQFVPPNRADTTRRVLEVDFRCPDGHIWTKAFPLK